MTTRYLGTGKNFGNQRLMAIADPQAETDAVNLQSARRLVQGVTSRKEAARVVAVTNINIASPGAAIDGVTLANGDRVLLAAQTTGSQNGIYDFNGAASAMTRSADADSNEEVKPGTQVFVSEGTTGGNSTYQLTTDGPIVVGTTALTWAQTGGAGTTYSAGNGLTLTGSSFSVNPAANGGIAVAAGGVSLASGVAGNGLTLTSGVLALNPTVAGNGLTHTNGVLAVGSGTGISVTADAIAVDTSTVVRKFAAAVGNGALTTIPVTHNLGTRDITWQVYDAANYEFIDVDGTATDLNTPYSSFRCSSSVRCLQSGGTRLMKRLLGRLGIPFFADEPPNPTLEGEIWMDSATDQPRWKTWDTPSVSFLNGVKFNDIAATRWYMTQIGTPTTANWTVSRMYAVPFYMTRYGQLNGMAVDVAVAHTTTVGTLRAGIYYGNKYNTPTTLLQDFGTTAAGPAGVRTWAFTRELAAGQYWLVVVPQGGTGGTPQFRSAQGVHEGIADTGATPSTTFMNGSVNTYYSATTVAGALPASFGTIAGAVAGPRIAVKFGAS